MAKHEFWLTDDKVVRISDSRDRTIVKRALGFTASRVVNGIGNLVLELPPNFDDSLLAPDRMIQYWRAPTGGRLSLWRVYLIRRWIFQTSKSSETIFVYGLDANDLLRRRIVAAFASSAEASKTDYADDMMKEIVTESIADGVDPTPDAGTRVWSDLSIAGDVSLGPTITRSFPFDQLLTNSGRGVLPNLADASRIAGTEAVGLLRNG